MANMFYMPFRPAFDGAANTVPGAQAWFTLTGTNTPATVYSDAAGTVARSNPVVANGVGKFPNAYLNEAVTYRVRIYSATATVGVDTPLDEFDPYLPGMIDADDAAARAANSAAVALAAISGIDTAGLVIVTPEQYGALGDGVTNDSAAFRSAGSALMAANGGILYLAHNATYIVGQQDQSDAANWSFTPKDILRFDGLTGVIKIVGNKATLKAAAALKFGAFNADGTVYSTMPDVDLTKRASPYQGMIHAEGFPNGTLIIEDLTLDGNIQNLTIGGGWGDVGWQIKNAGLQLLDAGKVYLRNVVSKNHGTDGTTYWAGIYDKNDAAVPFHAIGCKFDMNGRQGFSLIGGRGMRFDLCEFTNAGRNGVIDSNPHAGFDSEPDGGRLVFDVEFNECLFGANTGAGYIAASGRTMGISFNRCRFVGEYQFAFWIEKPGHVFNDCLVAGHWVDKSINIDGPAVTETGRATIHNRTTFSDDPAYSSTGDYYGSSAGGVGGADATAQIQFNDCHWLFVGALLGPSPVGGAQLDGSGVAWHGTTTIRIDRGGRWDLDGPFFGILRLDADNIYATSGALTGLGKWQRGRLFIAGVEQFYAEVAGHNWASIAAGASTTLAVTVPGAKTNDQRKYHAAMDLDTLGLAFSCRVTADNTVTVTAFNPTAGAVDVGAGKLFVRGEPI